MPKKLVDKSQAYFWTRKWQEGEREADEDIKAGRGRLLIRLKSLSGTWIDKSQEPWS